LGGGPGEISPVGDGGWWWWWWRWFCHDESKVEIFVLSDYYFLLDLVFEGTDFFEVGRTKF
jgi:hypothetical protein